MPLEVIGAGLSRTGTYSLKLALERLGFGPCHHLSELAQSPASASFWAEALAGGPVDWERAFAGYRATADLPSCAYYRELAEAYPDAKVILTVRDPADWYASAQATIFQPLGQSGPHSAMGEVVGRTIDSLFGPDIGNAAQTIAAYERHNAAVRATVPPDRLLVYGIAEGWGPLCRFLSVPIPSAAFPVTNDRRAFVEGKAAIERRLEGVQPPADRGGAGPLR